MAENGLFWCGRNALILPSNLVVVVMVYVMKMKVLDDLSWSRNRL